MRIAYCTNVRLPSERAHGHQIAQVCDALSALGHEVTVYAPYRKNVITQDYWSYYGARKEVRLTHLGLFDPIDAPLPGFLQLWLLNWQLRRRLYRELSSGRFAVLYTRTPALLSVLLKTGMPTVLELHQLPRRDRSSFVAQCKRCAVVACLTSPMRDALITWGVPAEKVIVEGDAVDPVRFASLPDRASARKAFNIATDRTVVGYVGRLKTLGMEKGVKHLLESLATLRTTQPFFGLIVGGPERDRLAYARMAEGLGLTVDDVRFVGEVEAARVPVALAACDVLAMPFPDFPHYRLHMSPLKMFEYMAAGKPIITSDLPTVRDVLSEETAVFCVPGDTASLTQALTWGAAHAAEARERGERARKLVQERYTWEKRMGRILACASSASARPVPIS